MQLAADPITIEIAGEAYALRPTLLAAMRLAKKHGDFATIHKGIVADNVTITFDVIREGTGSGDAAADFFYAWDSQSIGLRAQLAAIKLPLLRYVLQLAGHDDDEPSEPAATGKPMPFADYYAELFKIGTGWLGWTPADTWAAMPAEILAAQSGRVDLIGDILKSVFGGSTDAAPSQQTPVPDIAKIIADGFDPAFDRSAYAAFKAKHHKGKAA